MAQRGAPLGRAATAEEPRSADGIASTRARSGRFHLLPARPRCWGGLIRSGAAGSGSPPQLGGTRWGAQPRAPFHRPGCEARRLHVGSVWARGAAAFGFASCRPQPGLGGRRAGGAAPGLGAPTAALPAAPLGAPLWAPHPPCHTAMARPCRAGSAPRDPPAAGPNARSPPGPPGLLGPCPAPPVVAVPPPRQWPATPSMAAPHRPPHPTWRHGARSPQDGRRAAPRASLNMAAAPLRGRGGSVSSLPLRHRKAAAGLLWRRPSAARRWRRRCGR